MGSFAPPAPGPLNKSSLLLSKLELLHPFKLHDMVLYTKTDETDTSIFTFEDSRNGKWSKVTDGNNYGGTSMLVWAIGTAVRVNFRGKGIVLFGTIDQGINVTVSADRGNPRTVFQFTEVKNYRQQLYNSSELEYGDHTLLVTQLFDHFPLIVDYAEIDTEETLNSVDSSSSGTSSGTSSPTQLNLTTSTTNRSSISSGAIAGVVVAIIILLGAILAAVIWRRRRRMRRRREQILPRPPLPQDFPLHTRPHVPETIVHRDPEEKAQLRALWQASQDNFLQTNREPSPATIPNSSVNNAKYILSHTSPEGHSSSFPSGQAPSPRADVDSASPSSPHDSTTSRSTPPPPPVTDPIVTGSSILPSGWSFHQRNLPVARPMEPPSPTGSSDSRGTFNSSDLDHAVPGRPDSGLPPYSGSEDK